jgi:hypothetical protein
VVPGELALRRPPDADGDSVVYGLGFPLQVSSDTAGIFLNRRLNGMGYTDFEAGTDLVLIRDLAAPPAPAAVVPLARNHEESYRRPDGRTIRVTMVKYPLRGGFVPLGARRPDGSPHPHAGTGFGMSFASAFAVDRKDGEGLPRFFHLYFEVQQYAYDGKRFRVLATEQLGFDRILPGWVLDGDGLSNAIPDGDDLLLPFRGGRSADRVGHGVLRWRRSGTAWRPVDFINVAGEGPKPEQGLEATLIRDRDGALLFTARNNGGPERFHAVKIWRSTDGGRAWTKVLDLHEAREQAPVSLNQGSDGTPYLAANVLLSAVTFPDGTPRPAGPRSEPPSYSRERIALWPLRPGGNGLESPIVLFDAWNELPRDGRLWWVDHPVGAAVRLADGAWHSIVCFRVVAFEEVRGMSAASPATGFRIREVRTSGAPRPPWRF